MFWVCRERKRGPVPRVAERLSLLLPEREGGWITRLVNFVTQNEAPVRICAADVKQYTRAQEAVKNTLRAVNEKIELYERGVRI